MNTGTSEFPKHPLPHVPQPQAPQQPHVQAPTVYVYDKTRWEYRVVAKNVADEPTISEDELNTLGTQGWELVAVVPQPTRVEFFFKRVRS